MNSTQEQRIPQYRTGRASDYRLLKSLKKEKMNRCVTEGEAFLWQHLRGKQLEGYKFRREHIIDQFVVDFACLSKQLIIEVDGGYHNDPEIVEADKLRTQILNGLGFRVIRFTNDEVLNNIETVLTNIKESLSEKSSVPVDIADSLPLGGGRGGLYSEVLHYLFTALPVFQHSGGSAYKPGLKTIGELDDFYGNPHRRYRTIHVAGTNGKGSVSHTLAAVLQGAGYKTGLFTSPHLTDFRERIKIDGKMISEDEVIEFTARSRSMFDKVQPSFFEMTAAMAFDHFARHAVDIAVIETGMGGRLDATNIIKPVMSVITNIGLDHTQFLGNNLIAIAGEKAGVIKPGVPVVIGETQPGPAQVFEEKARKQDCHIVFADQHARVSRSKQGLTTQTFWIEQNEKEAPLPIIIDLQGDYQQKNIITALIAVQCLRRFAGVTIASETILPSLTHAAQTTGLRGRWQVLQPKPLTVCDIGHNVAGMTWVVRQIGESHYKTLRMIVGFVNDKDISGMLALLPRNAVYYFTKASIPRALDEHELMNKASEHGLSGTAYPRTADAVAAALRDAEPEDMIFIGGSAFVVAEALAEFEKSTQNKFA